MRRRDEIDWELRATLLLAAIAIAIATLGALLIEIPALQRVERAYSAINAKGYTDIPQPIKRAEIATESARGANEEITLIVQVDLDELYAACEVETPAPAVWTHKLTKEEFEVACALVMGEAGGESWEGKIAVAQCILSACERDGIEPTQVRKAYKYDGWNTAYTEEVEKAVTAVFKDGERVCDEDIIFFYAPR